MTALCFLHSMAYVISYHAQSLQKLTGNRRELSRATWRSYVTAILVSKWGLFLTLSSWQTKYDNLKSLNSHLFACVRRGQWLWPRYETFGSLRLECESEFKGGKVGRFNLKSKLWKLFDHAKFLKQDDSDQPNAFSKYGQSKLKAFRYNQ